MNYKASILYCFIACLLAGKLAAQQPAYPKDAALLYRPFQLSFVSPLGTNGLESGRAVNTLSVNLLLGYAAGLEGIELAGLANLERYHLGGIQLAGLLNACGGSVEGIQTAGFLNLNRGEVRGAQFGGFANLNGRYSYAAQFAGFANVVADSSSGFQLAGFGNYSAGHSGLQLAGFGNTAGKNMNGIQLGGFINIAEKVNGLQMAGFINISKTLRGLQLGVVNVVDSVEKGTPVGVFSFVRKGYNHWEIWTSESMHLNTGFKFGTRSFYNILAVASNLEPLAARRFFGFAYGIGHAMALPKGQLSIDALAYQLQPMDKPFRSENGLKQLYQLKLSYDYALNKASVFAGPVFNALVQYNHSTNDNKWSTLAPYTLYSYTDTNKKVELWAGLQAGIRF